MSLTVKSTDEYSIARELGIKSGYILHTINGEEIDSILDYEFFDGETDIVLGISDESGDITEYAIEKDEEEDLGLTFERSGLEKKMACGNRCIFCFVDQLPEGLRKALYFKDDDWRFSFLMGNYITLSNITEKDFSKIISHHISPLYISVHATDDGIRNRMIGSRRDLSIMKALSRLADAGIKIHTQIVLCPGINDGEILEKSIQDLASLYPSVASLAVVPVGLTCHRKNLERISPVDASAAGRVIDICEKYADMFSEKSGDQFVYASDEMYIKAGRDLPVYESYGDFSQIENGVGLVRSFEHDYTQAMNSADKIKYREFSVATSVDFYPFMKALAGKTEKKFGCRIHVYEVKNTMFGESVTVSGLLCGHDVVSQLKGRELGSAVFVSHEMFNHEGLTLDDMTQQDMTEMLGVRCVSAGPGGRDFACVLFDSDTDF